MKRGTPSCQKLKRLAKALHKPLYGAAGILELLWHMTAAEAPDGGIGRQLSDREIAAGLDWRGDPQQLIGALLATGWLEAGTLLPIGCQQAGAPNRLDVHHWSAHCDDNVHYTLATQCCRFADGTIPKPRRLKPDALARYNAWVKAGAPNCDAAVTPPRRSSDDTAQYHSSTEAPTTTTTEAEAAASPPAGQDAPPPPVSPRDENANAGISNQEPEAAEATLPPASDLANPGLFAEHVIGLLQVPKNDLPQLKADRTSFKAMAERINAGKCGPPKQAVEKCFIAAKNFAQDPTIHNKAGWFTDWFRRTYGLVNPRAP